MKADDIMYVLEELGADGGFKRSGNHVMTNCVLAPWNHQSGQDTTRKMGVLVQQGIALVNCFYPGCYKGTLLDLVTEAGGKRVAAGAMTPEQVSNLKAFVLMAEDEEVGQDWLNTKPTLPVPQEVLDGVGTGSPYWRGRGVSDETEATWKLGEKGGRAFIPILDAKGEVVAVQGRLIPGEAADSYGFDAKPHDEKYRTWPVGFLKSEYLAGEHLLRKPVDFLIVVESPVDAMLLNEWLPHLAPEHLPFDAATDGVVAVATMGGQVSKSQIQKMVDAVSAEGEIAVGFDMDHAGRLAQKELVEALRVRVPRVSEIEWKRKDPSDDEGGKLSADLVKREALQAVAVRTSWLERRLRRLLTNAV